MKGYNKYLRPFFDSKKTYVHQYHNYTMS
uniref:Uncharacterized protein n=1 Tax=Anguilla anguilla TaxID=7936 RepID=A0A0E9VB13_ANGAN